MEKILINCFVEKEVESSFIKNAKCKIELNEKGKNKHKFVILIGNVTYDNGIYRVTTMDKLNLEIVIDTFEVLENEIKHLYLLK